MNQVLLYSIQPQHLINILNCLKTIEVRKRDLPQWAKDKLAKGEKVVGYGYCTKSLPNLFYNPEHHNYITVDGKVDELSYHYRKDLSHFNGLVVVKFEVSGSEKFNSSLGHPKLYIKACLQDEEVYKYGNGANLYAHHLTNITPIEPMELWEFISDKLVVNVCGKECKCYSETASYFARKDQRLTKTPQSFQTVWVKEELK